MIWIIVGILAVITTIALIAMYRIIPPSEAHLVVCPTKKMVCASDERVQNEQGSKWYLHIPLIRQVRIIDLTTKELIVNQETYEKGQARYNVKSSTKYRVKNVEIAAETFISQNDLQEQLTEVIRASVRAVTVRYDVTEARAKKQLMSEEIQKEFVDDFSKWGLELINFQLVDFRDTESSKIISDISKRREVEIEATTREQNAEKIKQAKMKEAESDEKAKEREIERDKVVGERQQQMKQAVAEKEKTAKEEEYEVIRVQTVKQAEIDKDKAKVDAARDKEVEEIRKEQKKVEGEGDRLRAEEQAKGEAAPIREKGLAEALAKEKLQAALNKFKPEAIRALVAEKIVDKDLQVGKATADALKEADVRVFSGGEGDKAGFDFAKLLAAMSTGDDMATGATLNRIARPNDLGLSVLGIENLAEKKTKRKPKKAGADALV